MRRPLATSPILATIALSALTLPSVALAQSALQAIDPAALEETVATLAAEMRVPGAVMLLRTPEGEFAVTYGQRGLDDPTPVTLGDHIRVGSNTKTWTGTVILQMAEEGKIALDDPVSKFRPDVPNGDAITIAELLSMRSGLFNYTTTFRMNDVLDNDPTYGWNPDDLLAMAFPLPVTFAPGEGYQYSNTNTVLLGRIAEKIDGKPLETIFHDRLFAPLGLDDTLLPARDSNAIPDPHPRGYMYGDNLLTIATTAVPGDMQYEAAKGTLLPNDQTDANPSWAWAAGGGISTAPDLADWVEALATGKVLGPEMQQLRMESLRPTSDAPGAALYGYNIAQFGPLYGHTGELPGFNSFMGHDPVNHVTLVVWTNLAPAADGRDPATTIARALLGHVYAKPL